MRKFADVIERVEIIRKESGMNKAQFATAMGMKPQTYSNFVGAQASKPSIDLIFGVVTRFQADPQWLLNGNGPMYLGERGTGRDRQAATSSTPARFARWTPRRAAQAGHLELVREVIGTLEDLQILLARLQSDFSTVDGQKSDRIVN